MEEDELPPSIKIDKEGKKVIEGRGRGKLGKYLNINKSEIVLKPRLPKKHTNEGTQTKKKDPIRYKSVKYYKTTECLEQHDRLHHSQHGKVKVQELKDRNYRAIFRKREHRCWNNRRYMCEPI